MKLIKGSSFNTLMAVLLLTGMSVLASNLVVGQQLVCNSAHYEVRPGESTPALVIIHGNKKDLVGSDYSDLLLFPNPSSDKVQIGGVTPEQVKRVTFYTLSGTALAIPQTEDGSINNSYDISRLMSGIYIVRVEMIGGSVVNNKLIKK